MPNSNRRSFLKTAGMALAATTVASPFLQACSQKAKRPNILYIMSDDHTSQAVGAYGSRLAKLNPTPNLDKLAADGILYKNCFVTNSICTPSRAAILTGQYSQTNGVLDLRNHLKPEKHYLPQEMKKLGYETAIIGKWHLHETPNFDYYKVLYEHGGQGSYFNPKFIETGTPYPKYSTDVPEPVVQHAGHSSDVITDLTIDWLKNRDDSKPFFLMHHYKAPHDMFENAPRYDSYLEDVEIPEPENLYEQPNYGSAATQGVDKSQTHEIGTSISPRHTLRNYSDMFDIDKNLSYKERTHLAYQHYLKIYLRCVKGVDDNLGRLFDFLKENDMWENTVIIYTGDQGMMLGEHDYQDKRWMYDESLRMPFIMHYPEKIKPNSESKAIINNTDFAPTMLELAGGQVPDYMQGKSIVRTFDGSIPQDWRTATYYRYWMHMIHHDIPAHFGIRTEDYKLIFFYGQHYNQEIHGTKSMSWLEKSNKVVPTPVAWEFYDLKKDPHEVDNKYADPAYKEIIAELKKQLADTRQELNETDEKYPHIQKLIDEHWDM